MQATCTDFKFLIPDITKSSVTLDEKMKTRLHAVMGALLIINKIKSSLLLKPPLVMSTI